MIEVGALDREHSLFQFDRLTTVLDREEVGSSFIHPHPSRPRLVAFDHLAHITDLLVGKRPANHELRGCR